MSENENKQEILLFFHPNSKACIKLREIVSKSTKNENIKYVNIDSLQVIPQEIKSIPSLVIDNKKILSGKDVFDYFTKEDEFEFVGFQGKFGNNIASLYSNIDDDTNNSDIGGSLFSSLDSPNMNDGIPNYEDSETSAMKIEDITSRRAILEKELGFDAKKSDNQ